MSGIFISYRRDDSAEVSHRLYQSLVAHFGPDSVFIDVEDIELGENFAQAIEEKVGFCDALIAVIGTKWLGVAHADGRRRLDDPTDWVRLEIASALNRGIKVIPVLVDGAALPDQRDLPAPLSGLIQAQALDIESDRMDEGVARLGSALEIVKTGTTTAALWFSMITRRHKALDPLDLHKPEVLWRALRFMLYMMLIEAAIRLPTVSGLAQAFDKFWYLLNHATANYIQYLGAGVILHLSMKAFGGQAKLQKSIAAFCFLTAYAPLIAVSQIPVWGLNISVLKDMASVAWSPAQGLLRVKAFVDTLGPFGIFRLLLAFVAATLLWGVYMTTIFQAFRTLHRLSMRMALVSFGVGLVSVAGFVAFVVGPYFGALYSR